jgi:hypothetical protein
VRERWWLRRLAAVELIALGQPNHDSPVADLDQRARANELCHADHVQVRSLHHRVRDLLELRSGC